MRCTCADCLPVAHVCREKVQAAGHLGVVVRQHRLAFRVERAANLRKGRPGLQYLRLNAYDCDE